MAIKAIDPVSGKVLASYDEMTPTVVGGIIGDVHEAFLKWRRTSFVERATMMREAAKILRAHQCFCLSNDRVAWSAHGRTVRFIPVNRRQ